MMLEVTHAKSVGGHRLQLTFNDGRVGVVDFLQLATESPASAFAKFADVAYVQRFTLAHGTLCWPGECDVAAEYLFFLAFRDEPALAAQFRDWGYVSQARAGAAA